MEKVKIYSKLPFTIRDRFRFGLRMHNMTWFCQGTAQHLPNVLRSAWRNNSARRVTWRVLSCAASGWKMEASLAGKRTEERERVAAKVGHDASRCWRPPRWSSRHGFLCGTSLPFSLPQNEGHRVQYINMRVSLWSSFVVSRYEVQYVSLQSFGENFYLKWIDSRIQWFYNIFQTVLFFVFAIFALANAHKGRRKFFNR